MALLETKVSLQIRESGEMWFKFLTSQSFHCLICNRHIYAMCLKEQQDSSYGASAQEATHKSKDGPKTHQTQESKQVTKTDWMMRKSHWNWYTETISQYPNRGLGIKIGVRTSLQEILHLFIKKFHSECLLPVSDTWTPEINKTQIQYRSEN